MALGRVRKTGIQSLKKGEYVLPYGVKPTRQQLKTSSSCKCKGKKKCKK